jgi:anti-anti-sigma factor
MDVFAINSRDSTSFELSGELDMGTVTLLQEGAASAAKHGPVMFEVSDLTFVDSTGIDALVRLAVGLESGCLVLHGVQNGLMRLLEISGLMSMPNLHMLPCSLRVK